MWNLKNVKNIAKRAFDSRKAGSLQEAVAVYEKLSPQRKNLDKDGQKRLGKAVEVLKPAQQFVVLSKNEEFSGIHSRLFDTVHPPKEPKDLIDRLGDIGSNKVAFAMAVKTEDGEWFPTAVVYTCWSDKLALQTSIMPILEAPVQALQGDPKMIVPYAISSNFPGAGKQLIDELHRYVYDEQCLAGKALIATLSPLRAGNEGYATWLKKKGYTVNPDDPNDALKYLGRYLMPRQVNRSPLYTPRDLVQRFHMLDNGAMLVGVFPCNGNSPVDKQLAYGTMVSYLYPPNINTMENNKNKLEQDGRICISPVVEGTFMDYSTKVMVVDPWESVSCDGISDEVSMVPA